MRYRLRWDRSIRSLSAATRLVGPVTISTRSLNDPIEETRLRSDSGCGIWKSIDMRVIARTGDNSVGYYSMAVWCSRGDIQQERARNLDSCTLSTDCTCRQCDVRELENGWYAVVGDSTGSISMVAINSSEVFIFFYLLKF